MQQKEEEAEGGQATITLDIHDTHSSDHTRTRPALDTRQP